MLEEAVSPVAPAILSGAGTHPIDEAEPFDRKVKRQLDSMSPARRAAAVEKLGILLDAPSDRANQADDVKTAKMIAAIYLDGLRKLGSRFYVMRDVATGKDSVCEEYPDDGWTDEGCAQILDLCRVYRGCPGAKRQVREQLISEGHIYVVNMGAAQ